MMGEGAFSPWCRRAVSLDYVRPNGESKVHEFETGSADRLVRLAPVRPPAFNRAWLLKPAKGPCLTVTKEVGKDNDPAGLQGTDQSRCTGAVIRGC